MTLNMNNNNIITTFINHHCFENIINNGYSPALKIENHSKVFESDTNRIISLRKINFTVNKDVFVFVSIKGPHSNRKYTLSNILKALEKQIYGKLKMVKSKKRPSINGHNDIMIAYQNKKPSDRSIKYGYRFKTAINSTLQLLPKILQLQLLPKILQLQLLQQPFYFS